MSSVPPANTVVSRPAIPPLVRIRRSVLSLPANDPIITFYGRAIGEMKLKLIGDPLSWRYQAAIHDYPFPDTTLADRQLTPTNPDGDPSASASDVLPVDRATFWRRCQHNSWFFLPWHRMYIHHFEKMIMSHVARLGGPTDWALPYWNYSATDAARLLPAPFRSRTLPDGSTNHLFVSQRDLLANAGQPFASAAQADTTACLSEASFTAGGGNVGFGGRRTGFNHSRGAIGALENTPHGDMHVAVSGSSGFMGGFKTAPLDPIFWLHHCNIDRLWKVWLRSNPAHVNPATADWLTFPFSFHDATGAPVSMTASQVLDTRPAPLDYIYDDEP